MDKSIEAIWKEGFLREDALIAPKINDLYNQKSIDIVDKFKRMYTKNIIFLFVFAIIMLPINIAFNMAYMGVPMFFLFLVICFFALKFKKKLDAIDKNLNSYQYLKTFEKWTKEMIQYNSIMSRFLYPFVFLCLFAGFWFGNFGGDIPGQAFVNYLLENNPDLLMVFGMPLFVVLALLIGVLILAYFGKKIGKFDLNLVYGRILKRLERLLNDMEELRS